MRFFKTILGAIALLLTVHLFAQIDDLDALEKSLDSSSPKEVPISVRGQTNEAPVSVSKPINLRGIIEEGLRRNFSERTRIFKKAKFDLEFDDAYENFWYPKLNLELQSEPTLVRKLYKDNSLGNGTTTTPGGYVGLTFEDYKIFNWGRDYLNYLNEKDTYERNKVRLSEDKRHLRFNLIAQYFNLARAKNLLELSKYRLRQASFIYRLNREKLGLKKINQEEFLLSKQDFYSSQQSYQEHISNLVKEESTLSDLLGDDPNTSYQITEALKFAPMIFREEEALSLAQKQSPELLDKKLNLNNSERSYEKAVKDNLPLPEFNVRLGAFKHHYGAEGSYDRYETSPYNKNIEVVASINMTWRIFGGGGFLNQRETKKAYLDKRISEIEFLDTTRKLNVELKSYFKLIKQEENKIKTSSLMYETAKDAYDRSIDNYIGSKTSYPQIRLALENLVKSKESEENSKLNHLFYKLDLAKLIGVDDLPGNNFETLVVK